MTDAGAERRRVRALIERAGVAMLMNVDEQRHAHRTSHAAVARAERPAYLFPDTPELAQGDAARGRPQVGLDDISTNCYVVVAGSAHVSRDPELIRRLWSPTYRAWFPDGKDDREATVIRVAVNGSTTGSRQATESCRLVQAVKAVVTRRAVETPMKTLDGL